MDYFQFQKKHDYLVCIDSDGCAMDTMNVKHIKCFGPEWIKQFGLQAYEKEGLEFWNKVNLFSATRGINRFKGLAIALQWVIDTYKHPIKDFDSFLQWTHEAKELSNPSLLAACQKTSSKCMENALLWSIHVNLSIAALPKDDKPFPFVRESMESMCQTADLVAVSSANGQAVEFEWSKHHLKECCLELLSQEAGSKAYCIEKLIQMGYSPEKILMVGDAPGDRDAAFSNGVHFYPILVGKESESWERIVEEAFDKLTSSNYSSDYQQSLLRKFESNLMH